MLPTFACANASFRQEKGILSKLGRQAGSLYLVKQFQYHVVMVTMSPSRIRYAINRLPVSDTPWTMTIMSLFVKAVDSWLMLVDDSALMEVRRLSSIFALPQPAPEDATHDTRYAAILIHHKKPLLVDEGLVNAFLFCPAVPIDPIEPSSKLPLRRTSHISRSSCTCHPNVSDFAL